MGTQGEKWAGKITPTSPLSPPLRTVSEVLEYQEITIWTEEPLALGYSYRHPVKVYIQVHIPCTHPVTLKGQIYILRLFYNKWFGSNRRETTFKYTNRTVELTTLVEIFLRVLKSGQLNHSDKRKGPFRNAVKGGGKRGKECKGRTQRAQFRSWSQVWCSYRVSHSFIW